MEPNYGTNIGRALKSGLRVFEREDEMRPQGNETNGDSVTNRIMVLISDGEDHGRELEEAVKTSSAANIRVYCIGIGSRRAVPIPIGVQENGMRLYLQNENESRIHTQFSQGTLKSIADDTSARFYRAFVGFEMERAFQDIILNVRRRGDEALKELSLSIAKVNLTDFKVSQDEFNDAEKLAVSITNEFPKHQFSW